MWTSLVVFPFISYCQYLNLGSVVRKTGLKCIKRCPYLTFTRDCVSWVPTIRKPMHLSMKKKTLKTRSFQRPVTDVFNKYGLDGSFNITCRGFYPSDTLLLQKKKEMQTLRGLPDLNILWQLQHFTVHSVHLMDLTKSLWASEPLLCFPQDRGSILQTAEGRGLTWELRHVHHNWGKSAEVPLPLFWTTW